MTELKFVPAPEAGVEPAADRAGRLHMEIKRLEAELAALKPDLVAQAAFKEGCRTGHLAGNRFKVAVELRENVTWDQDKVEALRDEMPEEAFVAAWRWKFEAASKRAMDDALAGPWGDRIREARTVRPGSPGLTFKALEDC
jgi:hypothetical protein